jgi:hypothetical protein
MALGRHAEARAHWHECFALAIDLDNTWLTSFVVEGRARLALLEEDPDLCIKLLAAGDAARKSIGAAAPEFWSVIIATTIEAARARLPRAAAEKAWREGQSMTAQEIMASVIGPG